MKDNADVKITCFEDVYESFRLNTIHRYFNGTDSNLIAVFCLFELLHNFRDLINFVTTKEKTSAYSYNWWYKSCLESIENGHFSARPKVYQYVFKKRWLSKKKKAKILNDARDELLRILKETGIKKFIETTLEALHEKNL